MPTKTYTIMEFHLSRELPNASGFALGLSGAALLFFSIAFHNEGAPVFLGVVGFLLLLLSILCFTFKKIIRMDKRTEKIEETLSMFLWKKQRNYSVSDFTGVGIGMGGRSMSIGTSYYPGRRSVYLVQLLGSTNLNIPGTSGNKEAIVSLAEQIGEYLNLPVEKAPRTVFFQTRL